LNGTYAAFEEANKGSLETGKLADLAVLSSDYFSIPVDQVMALEAVLT